MKIDLEEITFDHDPESAETSALNLRKNEQEPVTVPEWRNTPGEPEVSPVAYAINATDGKTITIRARFSGSDLPSEALFVRAIPLTTTGPISGRSLGSVAKTLVTFNAAGKTESVSFDLADVKLKELGVGVSSIEWRWQYSTASCQTWVDFANSAHRIYRVLDVPSCPWIQQPFEPGNIHLPWTEVLDYACVWAASAHTADEAARLVTHGIYDLGLAKVLTYNIDGGSNYADSRFDCTALLQRLRGEESRGSNVNCTDCATIVSTFANALGCELSQSQLGSGFVLNPHLRIGRDNWETGEFVFHELAWKGCCTKDDEVFDACLILDGDDAPDIAPPEIPLLATNLLFGEFQDRTYRFHLAPDNANQNCEPRPGTKTRRLLGHMWADGFAPLDEPLLTFLKRRYEFDSWRERGASALKVSVHNFQFHSDQLPGWQLLRQQRSEEDISPSWLESFWHPAGGGTEVLLRVDVFEAVEEGEAPSLLLRMLGGFDKLAFIRRDNSIGDVTFANAGYTTILFTLGRLVCVIRNVGNRTFPVHNVAHTLKGELLAS